MPAGREYADVAEVPVRPEQATVYELGWQSWSPAGRYSADTTSPRPARPLWQLMGFRPDRPPPAQGFQGEGLLAVEEPGGVVRIWSAVEPTVQVPSIRAQALPDRIVVSADGPVTESAFAGSMPDALAGWAQGLAGRLELPPVPSLPPIWCSWYEYWGGVTERDVADNLTAIDRLGLDVGVVQVDDGHQEEIGDWVSRSPRFGPLRDLAGRIRDTGRRAGVWTAPFLVGARSRVAAEHPDWLVGDLDGADRPLLAAQHWTQDVYVLDTSHPGAQEHLVRVFATLAAEGYSFFKIDFLYAGAQAGRRYADLDDVGAYRQGLSLIRGAVGSAATILGCGAPLLPSLGLVDAMRISPDVDAAYQPPLGDVSQPGGLSAIRNGRSRAFLHGRFWVNDPDCALVRPAVAFRDELAEHVVATGGLAGASDSLAALDPHGVDLLRQVLRPSSPDPVRWDPDGGGEQGVVVMQRRASC